MDTFFSSLFRKTFNVVPVCASIHCFLYDLRLCMPMLQRGREWWCLQWIYSLLLCRNSNASRSQLCEKVIIVSWTTGFCLFNNRSEGLEWVAKFICFCYRPWGKRVNSRSNYSCSATRSDNLHRCESSYFEFHFCLLQSKKTFLCCFWLWPAPFLKDLLSVFCCSGSLMVIIASQSPVFLPLVAMFPTNSLPILKKACFYSCHVFESI